MADKTLKILHIFDNYLPQTENWAYNLIATLPDCEVHIAAKNYLKNNFYDPRFCFVDNYFDELDKLNRKIGKQTLSDLFKKLVIKIIPFVFGKVEQVFSDYSRTNQIHLVHAHFANIGWEFRRVAQKSKVPLIISFYGWDYEKLPYTKPEYKGNFKTLFKIADGFICEGNHGASILESYGCPKDKIFVVRLGVWTDKIPVINRMKEANHLNLVQIASFTEKKGQRYAIDAVAKVIGNHPNIKLTFIGNDRNHKSRTELENMIQEYGLESSVRFLPAIDYKILHSTLAEFDVFIHPSCYAKDRDCEGGAPTVLLDAQATGMPVIATKHCDIPDEVVHGQTGLLSEERNSDALAESIRAFYKMDNKTYQNFAQKARAHIEQYYKNTSNAYEMKKVYDKIIARQ